MAKTKNTPLLNFRVDKNGDDIITIKEVTLMFEHCHEPWSKKPEEPKKYSGRFLLCNTKHSKEIEILNTYLEGKKSEFFKSAKLKPDALFMRDGDNEGQADFEDHWVIAASEREDRKPALIDRDKSPVKKSHDKIYSGATVNVMIKPWKQDNDHGKKINANLLAVQFFAHGEKKGGAGGVSKEDIDEGFDEYEVEEMDDDDEGFDD